MVKTLLAASLAFFPILNASAQQTDHKPGKMERSRAAADITKDNSKREKGKPCAEYGAGFLQVPGTNTCIKVGGSISVEGRVH